MASLRQTSLGQLQGERTRRAGPDADGEGTPLLQSSFSGEQSSSSSSVYHDAKQGVSLDDCDNDNGRDDLLLFQEEEESTSDRAAYYDESGVDNNSTQGQGQAVSSKEQQPQQCQEDLKQARRLLYTSHLFAQASEVSWQFCLVLFLSALTNYESLALVSTYGLMSSLAVCFAGGSAGKFVDSTPRLHAARLFIWTENCAVLLATLCCYFLLPSSSSGGDAVVVSSSASSNSNNINIEPPNVEVSVSSWVQERFYGMTLDTRTILLLLGLHVLGSLAYVLDRGFMVAIERDWVVVMSQQFTAAVDVVKTTTKDSTNTSDDGQHQQQQQTVTRAITGNSATTITTDGSKEQWLSHTNVAMRQIDLSCKVAAPTLAGYIVVAFGEGARKNDLSAACVFVGILNVLSLLVEYECTSRIYHLVPALQHKVLKKAHHHHPAAPEDTNSGMDVDVDDDDDYYDDPFNNDGDVRVETEVQVDFSEPDVDVMQWSRDRDRDTIQAASTLININLLTRNNKDNKCGSLPSPSCLPKRRRRRTQRKTKYCIPLPSEWLIYLDQEVAPAGLALACL
jgi:hypothetical protein